ncbi:MAG: ankyrin repeat domain-containing protein [Actinomycetota bacterium]|nr:ankyrin repeat domain-containing protein [Actinomycetota bacterium]
MSDLLATGADPHAKCLHGRSVAGIIASQRVASVAERVAMQRMLSDAGVDLDRPSPSVTPLAGAAMLGVADAIEALLAAGANPHSEPNALGLACFSFSADRDPGIERTVDLLIAAGLDPNDVDDGGYTPLHAALSAGAFDAGYAESDGINVAAAVALIRHGASIDITFLETGYRPLHAAAAGESAILVETLLDSGADPSERTPSGESPLDVARGVGAVDCVRLLEVATSDR